MAQGADKHQKTEQPTAKRKREARDKGQVAHSQDLTGWFVMLAVIIAAPAVFGAASARLEGLWAAVTNFDAHPAIPGAMRVLAIGFVDAGIVLAPVLGIAIVAALVGSVGQTGFLFSVKKLKPDFSRISPIAGFKRMFSATGFWQVGKSALKLLLVGVLAVEFILSLAHEVTLARPVALQPVVAYLGSELSGFLREVVVAALLVSFIDYFVQRRQTRKSLMMTKQETKDERRQVEGDPLVRGQRRKRQIKLTRLRILASVGNADVVVANPQHYAVALRYERGRQGAPQIVAKGKDALALRIREEAERLHVPIIEDPPVARLLYATGTVGSEIPAELYLAVARLLAFVYGLPVNVRAYGSVYRRPRSALVA